MANGVSLPILTRLDLRRLLKTITKEYVTRDIYDEPDDPIKHILTFVRSSMKSGQIL